MGIAVCSIQILNERKRGKKVRDLGHEKNDILLEVQSPKIKCFFVLLHQCA